MVFLASHQSKSSSADPLAQIVTCGVLNWFHLPDSL
jgi:hypothetical protein